MKSFDISEFNPNNNMYIQASAGTGKTYTIQQIVAKLLKTDPELNLENILIVTFTEKAAGELKDRIRSKLAEEKMYAQLEKVDNAPICTIHSFCQDTIKEFSFVANLCSMLVVINDDDVDSFGEKYLRDELTKDSFFMQTVESLDTDFANDFIKKIKKINKKIYLDKKGQEVPDLIIFDKPELTYDVSTLNSADLDSIQEITKKVSDTKSISYSELLVFEKLKLISLQADFQGILTNVQNSIDAFLANSKGNTKKSVEELKENLAKYNSLFNDFLSDNNTSKELLDEIEIKDSWCKYFTDLSEIQIFLKDLNKLVKLLQKPSWLKNLGDSYLQYLIQTHAAKFYIAWMEEKESRKVQTFDDMIRNIREAICDSENDLKNQLQKKYKYVIIDEFQDTNQKQWDIFRKIFMEDQNHSIFVVGDPKQSIYRFQGADINVYNAALKEIENGQIKPGDAYTLDTNWRSTHSMIKACNALFSKVETDNPEEYSDFFDSSLVFLPSKTPQELGKTKQQKPDALYKGLPTKPFWIPLIDEECEEDAEEGSKVQVIGDSAITDIEFAQFALDQIIHICSENPDKKGETNLQVYKKTGNGNYKKSNVLLSDIAILCKSKTEMEPIKRLFQKAGIPYLHYKEKNLFKGSECANWADLLAAIAAEDFTGANRKILSDALFTKFFGVPFHKVSLPEYDRPDCKERRLIIKWQQYSQNRLWSAMLESIYEDTKLEEKLSSLDRLSELAKFRQIGDYCVSYLYENNCTLAELVSHLKMLSSETNTDEEDDNLVARNTDFNAVQIMTVHASKGLEFPVVIAAAGFKGKGGEKDYIYHDFQGKCHLAMDGKQEIDDPVSGQKVEVSKIVSREENEEFLRLFYVAYTRAESLMILPYQLNDAYDSVNIAFEKSLAGRENPESEEFLEHIPYTKLKDLVLLDFRTIKAQVSEIINFQNVESTAETEDAGAEARQIERLGSLKGEVINLKSCKYSYTKLSQSINDSEFVGEDNDEHEEEVFTEIDLSEFDLTGIKVDCNYDSNKTTKIIPAYPKGAAVGEAVHQILEVSDFMRLGTLSASDVLADEKLENTIRAKFQGQGLGIDSTDSKGICKQTANIIWSTLNGVLPEIVGSKATGKSFSLKEIPEDKKVAEAEFNLNPKIQQNKDRMKDYFNGFIDLLFTREVNGKTIYSIADWKTDSLGSAKDYASEESLKKRVDEHYSIQRVLYSYSLIVWLKQFYSKMSESEIFNEMFGGVYYVFVKGCKEGNGNGIYAHTWNSWEDLKSAFENIIEKKISGNRGM